MKSIQNLTQTEKLSVLEEIANSEDRFFSDYMEELVVLAKDPDEEIRMKAIDCLWDYPSKNIINLLFGILESERNEKVRTRIIVGLGRYIFELEDDEIFHDDDEFEKYNENDDEIPRDDLIRVKKFLMETFEDETKTPGERRYALEGLGFSSDENVQRMIDTAYHSEDKAFRQSAIFAMGRSGLEMWDNILVKELANSDKEMQLEAIRACGNAAVEKAGKKIEQLTHSKEKNIMLAAIWALGQTGWKDGFERLNELSSNRDKDTRLTAEAALEEWFVSNGEIADEDEY